MPQSDILNPMPHHPLNPDYNFQKKRPITHLNQKAKRGVPFFRDITDVGHQFLLNWMDRPEETAVALKRYYEQYRDGFFTFIDHEGGGRHYVGRFDSPVEPVPTAHGHWSIQQVTFDEVPGVPMVRYPDRWDRDAVWQLLVNDFGDVMTATSGANWTLGADASCLSNYGFVNTNVNATDWAAFQYYGYGFQFWCYNGPSMGKATISLDGSVLETLDFYTSADGGNSTMLYEQLNVPLGIHVVQLTAMNTKNSASAGNTIAWDALKVMR